MKQLLQSEFNKGGKIYKNISSPETSGTQTQVTNINLSDNLLKLSTDNGATFIDVATQQGNSNKSEIEKLANNNIKIHNANSGFSAGNGATATSGGAVGTASKETNGGGAVGSGATAGSGGAIGNSATAGQGGAIGAFATATSGGAVGTDSKETNGGGAVGSGATADSGGAVGASATAGYGGAIGASATAGSGGAIGASATAGYGGAIGASATAEDGFSGGFNAQVGVIDGAYIDAIQLGTGTNNTPKTLQVYDHKVYDSTKDSLYGSYINDKTPAVIETVWSGSLKNDGSTTITVNTYRQYDYFILYGSVYGQFCNIISNKNGTYGFTKKAETDSDIFAYSFVYTGGSFTWGESGYYANGNFTFVDKTGTSSYILYKIEGVKICKE